VGLGSGQGISHRFGTVQSPAALASSAIHGDFA
jgi:hypothetical protein